MYESNHYGSYGVACTQIHTRWSCWRCTSEPSLPKREAPPAARPGQGHTSPKFYAGGSAGRGHHAKHTMSFQLHVRSPYGKNAVRSNSSRPLTAATGESVQVAPASTANLAAGDGAAAAPAAAGAQPQVESGHASGRICVKPKLRKIEADTVHIRV